MLFLVETHYNDYHEDQSLSEKTNRYSKSMLIVLNIVYKMSQ